MPNASKCYPVFFLFSGPIFQELDRQEYMMDNKADLSSIKDGELAFDHNIGFLNNEEYEKIRQESMLIHKIISSSQPVGKSKPERMHKTSKRGGKILNKRTRYRKNC